MIHARVFDTKRVAVWNYENFLRNLMKYNSKLEVKRFDYKQMVKIGDDEIWFLSHGQYPHWCKGRTYIMNGKSYHSGYLLKGDENGNN